MPTSELGFSPVLHNLTAERVVFIYNSNNADSLEVAQYYRDQRGVPNENLVGLAISAPVPGGTGITSEATVLNETDYLYQIENPLITALEDLGTDFSTDGTRSIWGLILGFGIPVAYEDNGEVIAIASRLHRLGHAVGHRYPNHTYDRRGGFQFFDDNDASELFVTAILDGPTKEAVKNLIDRSLDVDNQTFITGDVFIDPYGKKITVNELAYQEDILDFISNEVANLGLATQTTIDVDDPYEEPTISYFSHDSFYWGWFNPTYSPQLLLEQNERRVFLYNADDRSASNIHYYASGSAFDVNGSDFWCNIAINREPGYAACAGAVANPGSDAYLRPTPFFQALHQGATLGEAFLFASKYVSWKTILIGDPLLVVNFPDDLPSDQDTTFTLVPNDEVIRREKLYLEASLAWGSRQTRLLTDIVNQVVASETFDEAINMLDPCNTWLQLKDEESQTDLYFSVVSRWLRYIQQTTNQSLSQWLETNLEKITSRLNSVIQQTGVSAVSTDYIYASGAWEYTFTFVHDQLTLDDVFFELEIALNSSFDSGSAVIDVSSLIDVTGWKYEGQPFLFIQMPISGFPSNFSGRRVRYIAPSSNYLRSTEVYYIRWTVMDSTGMPLADTSAAEEIIIAS